MKLLNSFLILVIVSLLFIGCNENSPTFTEKPDIIIDSTYSVPTGGDPRGNYTPNKPFVYYFGNETYSLTQNSGEGSLTLSGSNSINGTLSYSLITKVAGQVGSQIYGYIPATESASGTWRVSSSNLIIEMNSRIDTIPFSKKNSSLLLIFEQFQRTPFAMDLDPTAAQGTTIWVFK